MDDVLGTAVAAIAGEPVPDADYPHQIEWSEELPDILAGQVLGRSSAEYHHPWAYPTTPVEKCPTVAGPFPKGSMPSVLLDSKTVTSEALYDEYANAMSPFETDLVSLRQLTPTNNLGYPVQFSSYLIWRLARTDPANITDFNLDADRGYGYKCWDWNRDRGTAKNVRLPKDPDGHQYFPPCTAPPQSEDPTYDSTSPLKLDYLDQGDPGCEGPNVCPQDLSQQQEAEATEARAGSKASAARGRR